MKPNEVLAAAQAKIAGRPEVEAEMRTRWDAIKDLIGKHVLSSGKRHKVYEVHHYDATARLEFLTAFVEGDDYAECERRALVKVGVIS